MNISSSENVIAMQHEWHVRRFDELYRCSPDPWALEGSWYEQRKRALVLASLPQARYASAFEPGCAQGLLTRELAARCDRLLASDCSPRALANARERLRQQTHVELVQGALPDQWPAGHFDLLVLSELLYYLAPTDLDRLLARLLDLSEGPLTVLACHWRHPIAGCALGGAQVHERLRAALPWTLACSVADADFVLDVWTRQSASLAAAEGRI